MEPRTIPTLGGGSLEIGRGTNLDQMIFLDRRFSDGSASADHWVRLASGERLWPYTTGLHVDAARVLRDALTEAIDELDPPRRQPPQRRSRRRGPIGASASSRALGELEAA